MASERTYWTRRVSRRAALRTAGVAVTGVGAAALIGCGEEDEEPPAGTPTPTAAGGSPTAAATSPPAAGAASPGDWDGVKRGGTVVSTLGNDPPTLDPFGHLSFLSQYIGVHAYSRLLKFNSGPGVTPLAEIVPDVAESYEVADDGLSVVFRLRPGVTFHAKPPLNGRELEAEDVLSSFERFREVSPNAVTLENVERVEAADERTVIFHLSRPSASFLENIASPSSVWVMSAEANAGEIDPTQVDGVIGTGPWVLTGHRPSVEIVYEANPEYFLSVNTSDGDTRLPLLDGLTYLIISEYAQALTQFVAGRTHVFTPRNSDIQQVRGQYADVQEKSQRPGWLGTWHSLNKESNDGLYSDVRARYAMSLALDRAGLIDAFGEVSRLAGEGIEIESGWTNAVVPWGDGGMFWWLDPQGGDFGEHAQWYRYDPGEAKKLLDAVGYAGDPVQMNFVTGTYGSTYDQFTEAQIPMLRDAGFNVEPKAWEYRAMIGSEESKAFPGIFYNYQTPFSTIGEYVQSSFGPETPRTAPLRRYVTPELEELAQQQEVEFDRDARREIIHEIQRVGSGEMVAAPSVMSRWGMIGMSDPALRNWHEFETAGYGFAVEERIFWWLDS